MVFSTPQYYFPGFPKILPVRFETLVLGDVGLVVRGPREPVRTDLTDEGFHRQVDLQPNQPVQYLSH